MKLIGKNCLAWRARLPAFVANIARTSAGAASNKTGTVTLAPSVRTVAVQLKHQERRSPSGES